jgi:hypothetical protein
MSHYVLIGLLIYWAIGAILIVEPRDIADMLFHVLYPLAWGPLIIGDWIWRKRHAKWCKEPSK